MRPSRYISHGLSIPFLTFIALILLFLISGGLASGEVTLHHTYSGGWALVSVPLFPAESSPGKVYQDVARPLRVHAYKDWHYTGGGDSELTEIQPGMGHWLYLEGKTTIGVTGGLVNPAAESTILIKPGWNLVGNPWAVPHEWKDTEVSIFDGTSTLPLSQAVSVGWIEGNLHDYQSSTNSYTQIEPNNMINQQMEPWKGYLLYSNIEALLKLAPFPEDSSLLFGNLISPVEGAMITEPTAVIGSAVAVDLMQYTLEYALAGSDDFTTFMIGTENVEAATLGTFDPTVLINGAYTIRLSAVDIRGVYDSVSIDVLVKGNHKVGPMVMTFDDMRLDLPGLPIQIIRKYDSRDKRQGDFGVGWTFALKEARIEVNGVIGEGWDGLGGGLSYGVDPSEAHLVTVTLPDGTVQQFVAKLNPDRWQFYEPLGSNVVFIALPGSKGSLTPVGGNTVNFFGSFPGDITLLSGDGAPYDPDVYQYTTQEGIRMIVSRKNGMQSIIDRNGNTLTFTEDGITHSNGKGIPFIRDAEGRITEITDPEGRSVFYEYDIRGDLIEVTDRGGNTDEFSYDYRHNITEFINSSGIQFTQMEYDDDGRLIAMIDAEGNRIEYDHDVDGRQEIIKDRLGNPTVYDYDEAGNILVKTDPLGNTEFFTYDERDNMTSRTDPLGHTKIYTYDANNNKTSETDPDGLTTYWTYNSRNQMLSRTNPLGRKTEWEYDGKGNLTLMRNPDGAEFRYEYNAAGQKTLETDALGNITQYEYDSEGNITLEIDPLGNATEFNYDASGLVTCITKTRTTESGVVDVVVHKEYDREGNLIREVDAEGQEILIEYDALGQETARVLPGGRRMEKSYDARGNLTQVTHPDGTTTQSSFDPEGRQLTETDAAGRITEYEYDKAGRQTRAIGPTGIETEKEYNAAGNLKAMDLPTGASAEYEFDLAGRQTMIKSFNGGSSYTEYDDAGQVTAVTDALGRVTRQLYDDAGRQVAIVFPNGASREVEYDLLGRKIAEIDLAKNRMEYAYDAAGRVTCVTDALNQVTRFEYDELGNMLKQTDAKGRITRWTYDNKGRMLSRTLPLGMTEYYTYGTCCNHPVSHIDFRGNVIQYEYDSMGRLISKTYPNDATEIYTYNALGNKTQVSSATGTTNYEYDAYHRLQRVISPDGLEVTYTYDSMGNTTSVTQPSGTTWNIYDSANQLSKVVDSASGETLYEYALTGRQTRITRPNGTITEYIYDDLDRLIAVVNKKSGGAVLSSYQYTLDEAGNRARVVEHSGRTVDYTYDATYKLTGETINDPTSGMMVITYEYDEVGNRTSRTVDGVTTTYTYDDNDRLLSEQTSVKIGQLVPDKDLEQNVGSALTVYRATVSFCSFLYLIGLFLVVRYITYSRLSMRDKTGRVRSSLCVLFLMAPFLVLGPEVVPGMQVAEIEYSRLNTTLQENLTYTYDDNGNRISKSDGTNTTDYTFDYDNRMVAIAEGVSRTEYVYDEEGLRIKQNVDGEETAFLYDKLQNFPRVLEEHSGESAVTAQYTWGIDIDPISMTQSGSTSYYLVDGNLNIRKLVNESEEITDSYDLEAFGGVLRKTGSTPNNYLLHGQYYDANAGYYYMRARWMDHATGGFTSLDPASGDPQYPLTLHKYLFAAGNPIMQYDPSGRDTLMEIIVVTAILSGLIMWMFSAIQYLIGAIFNGNRGVIPWEGEGVTLSGSGTWAGAGGSWLNVHTPECHMKKDRSGKVKGHGMYLVIIFGFTISWKFEFSLGAVAFESPFFFGPDGGVFTGFAGLLGGTLGIGGISLNYSVMSLGFGTTRSDSVIGITLLAIPPGPHPLPPGISSGTLTVARNLFSWQGGISIPLRTPEEKC